MAELSAGDGLAGLQCGSDTVLEGFAGDDDFGVDKLWREGVEIDLTEGLLAGLDAGREVGFGQLGDVGEVHEGDGGGSKGLLAALGAFGPRGDLGLALAGGLGEDVGVDRCADQAPDRVDRVGLAIERVEPKFRILFEVRALGEEPLLEGDNEGGRLCLLCGCEGGRWGLGCGVWSWWCFTGTSGKFTRPVRNFRDRSLARHVGQSMITASDGRVWSIVTDLRDLAAFCNDPECIDRDRVTTIVHIIGHLVERSGLAWRLVLLADWEDPRARLGRVARINKLTALSEALAKLGLWSISLCVNVRAWATAGPAEPAWEAILRGSYPHACVGRERTRWIVAVDDLRREQSWLPEAWRRFLSVVGVGLADQTTAGPRSGLIFDRVVDTYCQTIRLAIELLEREALRAVSRRRAAHWEYLCADSDKPRTDNAMRARDRRYAGFDHFSGSSLYRPSGGGDLDTGIMLGVLGGDKKAFWQTWEQTDGRIYVHKRGIERDARLGPARPTVSVVQDFTTALSLEEVKRAYDSFAFANRTGRILNGKVTVSWFLLQNVSEAERWDCFKRFYRSLKQWFRDVGRAVGSELADRQPWIVHVHENPDGDKFHTHFAMVVPEAVRSLFRGRVRGMVQTAVDGHVWEGGIGALVDPDVRRADRNGCVGQWEWFHYMLKGGRRDKVLVDAGPDNRRILDDILAWRYENPRPIGRRARVHVTRNLLPEAQQSFVDARGRRFVSLWDEQVLSGQIDVRQLFSQHYLLQEGRDATQPALPDQAGSDEDHPLASLIMGPGRL